MAGCPSGWTYTSQCNDQYSCNLNQVCSTVPVVEYTWYRHEYHRCRNNKTGVTDCYWADSHYSQCC